MSHFDGRGDVAREVAGEVEAQIFGGHSVRRPEDCQTTPGESAAVPGVNKGPVGISHHAEDNIARLKLDIGAGTELYGIRQFRRAEVSARRRVSCTAK